MIFNTIEDKIDELQNNDANIVLDIVKKMSLERCPSRFFQYRNHGNKIINISLCNTDRILKIYYIYFKFARDLLKSGTSFVDVTYDQFNSYNTYKDYFNANDKNDNPNRNFDESHILRFSFSDEENYIRFQILEKDSKTNEIYPTPEVTILSNGASEKEMDALYDVDFNQFNDVRDNLIYYTALRDFNNRSLLNKDIDNKSLRDMILTDILNTLAFVLFMNPEYYDKIKCDTSFNASDDIIYIQTDHFSFPIGFIVRKVESKDVEMYDINIIDTQFDQNMASVKNHVFPDFLR